MGGSEETGKLSHDNLRDLAAQKEREWKQLQELRLVSFLPCQLATIINGYSCGSLPGKYINKW